jgi:aspartate racemase
MRTIGLLGGMSWESSLHYYRLINEEVRRRLGPLHSAQLLLYSVDFQPIERMQAEGRWADAGNLLGEGAARLERGGADFIVLCTNTMHKVADAISSRVRLPLLHIADTTGAEIKKRGFIRVGLLGTRFTMEHPFYRDRLAELFQVDVITPPELDRQQIHTVIYQELCLGKIVDASRSTFQRVAAALVADGAQALILGCTEIMMLLGQDDVAVPVFDTTRLHALAAVDRALAPP